MTRMTAPVLSILAAAALVAAGCGSSSGNGSKTVTVGGKTITGSASAKSGTVSATVGTVTAKAGTSGGAAGAGVSTGSSATTNLAISADPGGALKFSTSKLTAKAGQVTITMKNPSSATLPHAVAITGNGVNQKGPTANPGGTSKVTASLKAGTYTFYCPIDAHRQAGMQGTLTVK